MWSVCCLKVSAMAVLHNMNGTNAPAAVILIRVLIGGTFLSAGIQKFLYPTSLTLGVSLWRRAGEVGHSS